MNNAVLFSFFSSTNLGDVILSYELYRLLSKKHNVICVDFTTGQIVIPNNKITIENEFKSIKINPIKSLLLPLYKYFLISKNYNFASIFKTLNSKDVVYVGGGNMIMDYDIFPDYTLRVKKIVQQCNKNNLKVALMSVGVGPIKSIFSAKRLRRILSLLDYISVRDLDSQEFLARFTSKEIFLLPDPAFMIKNQNVDIIKNSNYGINVMNINNDKILLSQYSDLISKLINIKPECKITIFTTEVSDYGYAELLYETLLLKGYININIIHFDSVETLISISRKFNAIISTRMHAAILAMTQGVPAIPLVWQTKVKSVFEYMNIGIPIFNIENMSVESDSIIENLIKVGDSKNLKNEINIKIEDIRNILIESYNNIFIKWRETWN